MPQHAAALVARPAPLLDNPSVALSLGNKLPLSSLRSKGTAMCCYINSTEIAQDMFVRNCADILPNWDASFQCSWTSSFSLWARWEILVCIEKHDAFWISRLNNQNQKVLFWSPWPVGSLSHQSPNYPQNCENDWSAQEPAWDTSGDLC